MLPDIPLILPGRPHGLRLRVDEIAAERGIRLNVAIEVDGLNTILDLAQKGIGCAVLTPPALYGYRRDGDLIATSLSDPVVTSTVVAITSRQRPMTGAVRTLLKILHEEARKVRHKEIARIGVSPQARSVEVLQPKVARQVITL